MTKRALVTGGNSGIGYATARLLKARSYEVTIAGRDATRMQSAAQELGVSWKLLDLANLEHIHSVAEEFIHDGIDAVVNNAALARFLPIEAHTPRDYDEFFYTNIRGPLALIQALTPALERRQGAITNISSAVVSNGLPYASLYAATKGAIDASTKSLAVELAPRGIRVNVVSPGAIDSPMLSKPGIPAEVLAVIRQQQETVIPLRRYGRPEEVAHVICAQIEATYVTGAVWMVDGGVDSV